MSGARGETERQTQGGADRGHGKAGEERQREKGRGGMRSQSGHRDKEGERERDSKENKRQRRRKRAWPRSPATEEEPQTRARSEFSKKHLSCYVSNYALGLLGE